MIYVRWKCDSCGLGGSITPSSRGELSTKDEIIQILKDDGWSVGKRMICPNCKNNKSKSEESLRLRVAQKQKRRKNMKRIGKVLLITLAVALLVLGASQALEWIEDILTVYFGAVAPMVFIGLLVVAVGVGYGILLTRDKGKDDD